MALHVLCSDSCFEYNFREVHFAENILFLSGLEKQQASLDFQGQDLQSLTRGTIYQIYKK